MDDVHALIADAAYTDSIVQLNCGHKMHMECLKGWIEAGSNVCPGRCMPPIAPESAAQVIRVDPDLQHAFRDNEPSERASNESLVDEDDMQTVQARIDERAASDDPAVRALAAQQQETLDRVRGERVQLTDETRHARTVDDANSRIRRREHALRQMSSMWRQGAREMIHAVQQKYAVEQAGFDGEPVTSTLALLGLWGATSTRECFVSNMQTTLSLLSDISSLFDSPAESQNTMKKQADKVTKFFDGLDRSQSSTVAENVDHAICHRLHNMASWIIFFGVVDFDRVDRAHDGFFRYLSPELRDSLRNNVGEVSMDDFPEYQHHFNDEIRGGMSRVKRSRRSVVLRSDDAHVVAPTWALCLGLAGLTMVMAVIGA
jgi:hypothetical protein